MTDFNYVCKFNDKRKFVACQLSLIQNDMFVNGAFNLKLNIIRILSYNLFAISITMRLFQTWIEHSIKKCS